MKLDGKTALVTGASKGIGRAIALRFAAEGANLIVTGRSERELASLCDVIESKGSRCVAIVADLSERGATRRVYEESKAALGAVQILVNNAGIGSSDQPAPVAEYNDEFWDRVIYLNLTVPYLLSKSVLTDMLAAQWGRIINISSVNGKIAAIHGAAYAASKHGLLGLTRTIAIETVKDGVTVNAICPGPVRTALNTRRNVYDAERLGLSASELEAIQTPLGRRLEPDEVSPLAVYLASSDSSAVTGQSINVDGGGLMAA